MKRFLILFYAFSAFAADTNYLGCLTSTNQFTLSGSRPYVVTFESMEIETNIFSLLNHKESFITREDVPAFMPPGLVKLTVSAVDGNVETNVFTFTLLAPPVRVRSTRRHQLVSAPLPFVWKPQSLPGGTNDTYRDHIRRMESGRRRGQ